MNNNLLFSNKFISRLNNKDIPSDKKQEFKKHIENKTKKEHVQQIIEKVNTPLSNSNYENLAFFDAKKQQVIQQLTPINDNQIKVEKVSIVCIDSKDRDTNLYPLQSDFIAYLGKTFRNVKSIKLVSTEFPNTDQVITNTPIELQNNLISWENEEDVNLNFFPGIGLTTFSTNYIDIVFTNNSPHNLTVGTTKIIDIYNSIYNATVGVVDGQVQITVIDNLTLRFPFIGGLSGTGSGTGTCNVNLGYPSYTIQIKPGNYSINTLATEMQLEFNNVKRQNGAGQYHYFTVTANIDTDVLTFDSVITSQLANNPISTTAGSTLITVSQFSHGFKTGDRVTMINVLNTAGINGSILSGIFNVSVLDFNTFTYDVIFKANATVQGGGNSVLSGKDAPFRLLFESANTLIQYNIGFLDEDSSEYINASNPITTSALNINNVQIINAGTQLRFTTIGNHKLDACTVLQIQSVTTDTNTGFALITTTVNHNIQIPTLVTIRNTNSTPKITGIHLVIPNGKTTFYLQNFTILTNGTNNGQVLYGNDKIAIYNLKTIPNISLIPDFYVENIPSSNQFDITFNTTSIDSNSISICIIGTSQIYVNHPNHGFNVLLSINSVNTTFANVSTYLPNTLIGSRTQGVDITAGVGTNIININLINHGLTTSDKIIIQDSNSDPIVDGIYYIQVVDIDNFSINFVYATFVPGTGTIITGDTITLSNTNCNPRIDGTYSINNKQTIISSTAGSIFSTITTETVHNFSVNDLITISGSDNLLDGQYTIQTITGPTTFTISLEQTILSGTSGTIINNNRFFIDLDTTVITNSGIYPAGVLNRDSTVVHYRIEPQITGGQDIGGIQLRNLNGMYKPIERYIDTDNYMVRTISNYATSTVTAGGNNITSSSFFDGLRTVQANTDNGTSSGTLSRAISLEGENYVYMVIPNLETVLNSSGISNVFAKILLSESPGTLMFNSFISAPKIFDDPVPKLDTMRFTIVTSKNYNYYFNGVDYSFALEITELVDQLNNSVVSSRTGNTEYQNLFSNNTKYIQNNTGNYGTHTTGINRIGTSVPQNNK